MKKRIKINKKILLLIIIIVVVVLIALIMLLDTTKSHINNLEYINSDEMNEGTFSPEKIHVLLQIYKGDLNPKAISKSTYYFTQSLVPEYYKKCKTEFSAKRYYFNNKKNIFIDTGINSEEDFLKLNSEIQKLSGELIFESSRFGIDEMKKKSDGVETYLYIKYKNNDEIKIKVIIYNTVLEDCSTVIFGK